MRTVTRTYELFTFNELSDPAKEEAYRNWLCTFNYAWDKENRDTLKSFCDIFKVKCNEWQYDRWNYHYRFSTLLEDEVENLSGQRLATYLWNNYRSQIYQGKYYYKNGISRHSHIFLRQDCVLTGYYLDEEILAPIYAHIHKPNPSRTFLELIDMCLDSFFNACRDDYDGCQSIEGFQAEAEANEWEFLSDGNIFD